MTEMTDAEQRRQDHLRKLGNYQAVLDAPARTEPVLPTHQPAPGVQPVLGPPGVDPSTMHVDDIVFDSALLERFPVLTGREPLDFLFSLYKSKGKSDLNKYRNKALHAKCQQFIRQERDRRLGDKTGGVVAERLRTNPEQRENAQVLANAGIEAADLAKMIQVMQAIQAKGIDLDSLINTEA